MATLAPPSSSDEPIWNAWLSAFHAPALAIARGSRLSPAYRDGRPMAATALMTLFFDPGRANCPGLQVPDPKRPASGKPRPRVTQNDERPAGRAGP